MLRRASLVLVLAACAAPGPDWPGAAPDPDVAALLREPPVVRIAIGDHAGNAVILPGGRLASVRHVFEGAPSVPLKVDGRETGFAVLAQGAGGPAGDWIVLALDHPDVLAQHQVPLRAGGAQPGQELVIVGYLPLAQGTDREDLRELVALPGRVVAAPWLLRETTRGGVCVQLEAERPDFYGLSGSPAFVRERGAWRLCGVYSSQVTCWPWCEVSVVTPLPDAAN